MLARFLPFLFGIGLCHAERWFQIAPVEFPRPDHLTLDQAVGKLRTLRQAGRTEPAEFLLRSGLHPLEAVIAPELAGEGLSFKSADPESEFINL